MATKKSTSTKLNTQRVGKAKTKKPTTCATRSKSKSQAKKANTTQKQKAQQKQMKPDTLFVNKDGTIAILYK